MSSRGVTVPGLRALVLLGWMMALPLDGRAAPPLEVGLGTISAPGLPVGSTVVWIGGAQNAGGLRYRFSVGPSGGPMFVARDFHARNYFEWTPLDEGVFTVKVTVRSSETGESAEATASYTVASRVAGTAPGVFSTAHPLVMLYSMPPGCTSGLGRVNFRPVGSTAWQFTSWKLCRPGKSLNFYVGGLYADTMYEAQHQIASSPTPVFGSVLTFRSGLPTVTAPTTVLAEPPIAQSSLAESIVLHATFMSDTLLSFPYATDLEGRLLWYYDRTMLPWQTGSQLVRPVAGGTMLMVMNEVGRQWQLLREIDLPGNTTRETSVSRVSEQLVAMGQDPITAFHHDALRLANGHTLVLGSVERLLDGVQGPGVVDVLGDMVIDLDENLQVVWAWNAFDFLDPRRAAVLGETCTGPPDGCRPLQLAPRANDWTHANTIAYSPADGNVLVSLRHQDWVVKIDYRNGAGTGAVLWRLGPDGDFSLSSPDPWPWFSHQHDPVYDASSVVIYDNGNTRCGATPLTCESRGQVLHLDESALVATLTLNEPLGHYAHMVGSARRLSNGNYHFGSGWVFPGPHSEAIEFLPDGTRVYRLAAFVAYRSFRVRSLYTP